MTQKSILSQFIRYKNSILSTHNIPQQNVLFDFSSPNIAKPFHAGHLRATLLGNFIANVNEFFGHNVHRINYLGDCGSQIGYLLYGLKEYGDFNNLTPKDLCNIYTTTYQKFIGKNNAEIQEVNLNLFEDNSPIQPIWKKLKEITMINLQHVYERFGIKFTRYEFESDYHHKAIQLINQLQNNDKFTIVDREGAKYFQLPNGKQVTMTTSLNSSLYLSRDLVAARERIEKYSLDRIHYVVENGQYEHFLALEQLLTSIGIRINEAKDPYSPSALHLNFGRLSKMSTRMGNILFLDDIIEHTKTAITNKIKAREHRTAEQDFDALIEDMSKSVLITDVLRVPRATNYTFEVEGSEIGFNLQFCRVKINSLETRCIDVGIVLDDYENCFNWNSYSAALLDNSTDAMCLIEHLKLFECAIIESYKSSDSSHLIQYCIILRKSVLQVMKTLKIVNPNDHCQTKERMRLLITTRAILDQCLNILGIPLINKV